jgi:hypothetical protein
MTTLAGSLQDRRNVFGESYLILSGCNRGHPKQRDYGSQSDLHFQNLHLLLLPQNIPDAASEAMRTGPPSTEKPSKLSLQFVVSAGNYISIRSDSLDDFQGQRTGFKILLAHAALGSIGCTAAVWVFVEAINGQPETPPGTRVAALEAAVCPAQTPS